MSKNTFKCTSARAQIRIARLLDTLKDGPLTARELAAKLHCSTSLTTMYIARLMEAPRRVRIADHDIIGRRVVPMYGLGDKPDAKHEKLTPAELWDRFKTERPEQYQSRLELQRQRHHARRAALPPEEIKRVRKTFPRPLEDLILELLERRAGRTFAQIAGELNASPRTIEKKMRWLRDEGFVRPVEGPRHSREPWRWEVPGNPVRVVVRPRIQQQNIFSSLGL